jgi:hypothetical protein
MALRSTRASRVECCPSHLRIFAIPGGGSAASWTIVGKENLVLPTVRSFAAAAVALAVAGGGAVAAVTVPAAVTSAATVHPLASSPAPSPSPGGPVYNCTESGTAFTRSIPMTVAAGYAGGDMYSVTLTSGPSGLGGMSGSAQYPDFQSFLHMTGAQTEGIDMYGGVTDPATGVFSVVGEVALYTTGTDYIHFPDQFTMRPGTANGGSTYLTCSSAQSPAPVAVSVTVGGPTPGSSSPPPASGTRS